MWELVCKWANESECVSKHVIGVERQKQGHRKRGRGRDRGNEKNNNVESESCKGSERKSWLRSYVTIKHVTRRRREKIIEILCSQIHLRRPRFESHLVSISPTVY